MRKILTKNKTAKSMTYLLQDLTKLFYFESKN